MKEILVIASDHAGYEMKLSIIKYLEEKGYGITDLGTNSTDAVNYPDFGHPLAEAVESGRFRLPFLTVFQQCLNCAR